MWVKLLSTSSSLRPNTNRPSTFGMKMKIMIQGHSSIHVSAPVPSVVELGLREEQLLLLVDRLTSLLEHLPSMLLRFLRGGGVAQSKRMSDEQDGR